MADFFAKKKANFGKLQSYGFLREGDSYLYKTRLSGCGFEMSVRVDGVGAVSASVLDTDSGEPYTLHLDESAAGAFVGGVRSEYEALLSDIAERCFDRDVFKARQALELIEQVRLRFGDELEYLWQDRFPDNAVWRRKDTGKWYAVVLTVKQSKLGLKPRGKDEMLEVVDFRVPTEELPRLVDNRRYLQGYHMNKRHWCTVVLDGAVPTEEIMERLEESYQLAVK